MDQIIRTLPGSDDPEPVKLRSTKSIEGLEWSFEKGQRLEGIWEKDSWRVWPPGQSYAYICCVPSSHVKIVK